MSDAANEKDLIGGYGSDDKVPPEQRNDTPSGSDIPGVLADVPDENGGNQAAFSGEEAGDATGVEHLAGNSSRPSGGGTSGFGKGS